MEVYYREEILEAIEAADVAIDRLHEASESLSSASGWGLFDMFGGSLVTTMIKHGRINDAQGAIEEAKEALVDLKQELLDVDKDLDINIDIGGFLTVADYLFDNIFTDLFVQDKIQDAKAQVQEAINKVKDIKRQLQSYLA